MDIFMQTVRRALRFLSGIILVASFIFGLKRGTWLVTFGTDRSELRNGAYTAHAPPYCTNRYIGIYCSLERHVILISVRGAGADGRR